MPTLTDCWLGTIGGGGNPAHPLPPLSYSSQSLPFRLSPLVSFCLFTKTDTVPQSELFQFDTPPLSQRLGEERALLPPVLRQTMAVKCPPGSLTR